MKRVVAEQSLGFVATVRPDGTPALSPKGTTSVWDDEHLVFLHLHSPHTIANVEHNPHVEVNVVDPIVRKGYRFAGTAEVLTSGSRYEQVLDWFGATRQSDYRGRAKAAVLITVTSAELLVSPAYDGGATEADVSARWRRRHLRGEPGQAR
jgi:predicted pyridoxine 5'-phosphate oxidase superfamily flavin-nucleotide-binding protein